MHHKEGHNYSVWLIAQRLGVSENRVQRAIERVDRHRYDG
jgi:transposase-like protein